MIAAELFHAMSNECPEEADTIKAARRYWPRNSLVDDHYIFLNIFIINFDPYIYIYIHFRRFRDIMLIDGGSIPSIEAIRRFCGRDATSDSLLDVINLNGDAK